MTPGNRRNQVRRQWRTALLLTAFFALTGVRWPVGQAFAWKSMGESRGGNRVLIVPALDSPISPSASALWCGTFQLAWNEACGRFGAPGIELAPPSRQAALLNRKTFQRKDIDAESIFIASGAIKDHIVEKIQAHLQSIHAPESRILPTAAPAPNDVVFYARLDKRLSFPKPFGKLGAYPLGGDSFGARSIPCFGFLGSQPEAAELRSQALIHYYRSPEDFVVELKTNQPGDMLLLAKTSGAASLGEMSRAVESRLEKAPEPASGLDVLAAPMIALSETQSFAELQGRMVVGKSPWFIRSAREAIDLAMNEQGVTLHSESEVSFGCSAREKPKHLMILNPPFLLLLQRRGAATPYLACWIANLDALAK